MKIDPALPAPAGTQNPIQSGIAPSRAFEDLLSGGVAPGRAFGFAEFGMFGREGHAQSPVQIFPSGRPHAESRDAALPIRSFDEPVGRAAAHSPAAATPVAEPGPRPTQVHAMPRAAPRASVAAAAPADAGGASPSPEPAWAEEDAESAAATGRRITRHRLPRSDVSLIMSEKDGAVDLVAAGPALDPETCVLLRRLARAILARNGLGLGQFHLNGVPLASDSTIMIGGSHGTRTR